MVTSPRAVYWFVQTEPQGCPLGCVSSFLEPLSIKRTGPTEALEVLLKNLKSTPKLQVLDSEKSEIADNVSEVRVTWKIAQSRHTLESIYRILDLKDRRLVASISGRVELVAGVRGEFSQLWDSIRAE